ncbi:MAG: hypothetical protein [Microvirus sp.]|nr:MAG: hypothetical protein [Microvirus sp.]
MESGSVVLVRLLRDQVEKVQRRMRNLEKQLKELELRELELRQLIDDELENR